MKLIKPEFVSDLLALFEKHGYSGQNDIYRPNALGQAMQVIAKPCISLSAEWYVEDLYASHVINSKGNEIIKTLVSQLEQRNIVKDPYNYCDLDCNVWGNHSVIDKECLECDANKYADIFRKDGDSPVIKQVNCIRCGGTGIDPESKDHAYTVFHDNHGNSLVYILVEHACGWNFHIRRLPYNLSKKKMYQFFQKFCKSATIDRFDDEFEYMRYHDSRDEGFVFSMQYSSPKSYSEGYISDVNTTLEAHHAIDQMIQHFPCIFEE